MDAGAATELVERPGRQLADAGQQIEPRPQALIAEFEIERRIDLVRLRLVRLRRVMRRGRVPHQRRKRRRRRR